MLLALALLAGLAFWWVSKAGDGAAKRFGRALARSVRAVLGPIADPKKIAGSLALVAAGVLMLRGNLVPAGLLGLGGVWMLEGPGGIRNRLETFSLFGVRLRPDVGRRYRTSTLEVTMRADGTFAEGRIIAGPGAGTRLDDMTAQAVMVLLQTCRGSGDPEGAALLETYLDRRAPGWRVDAQRDRDPRTGGAPNPGAMTQEEAHQILGLQRGASSEEIRTAHRSLMKRAHPDQGGSAEGAARVNAARDRLLSRHR